MNQEIEILLAEQLSFWDFARKNYDALQHVRTKEMDVNGCHYKVQFNPARIVSSAAKVDKLSIQKRECFLCPANLPAEQKGIPFGKHYQILVNPFPIFPKHLTIPERAHIDQRILHRFGDMLDIAGKTDDYIIFYNGPQCGASAPDHAHFQAGNKGFLPIEQEWKNLKAGKIIEYNHTSLWYLNDSPRTTLVMESAERESAIDVFNLIYKSLERKTIEEEPMMNILAWTEQDRWIVCVFPRKKHRPRCYTAEGEANILISPASVDMGGAFITPLEKDFEKITSGDISAILSEVCLDQDQFKALRQRIKTHL